MYYMHPRAAVKGFLLGRETVGLENIIHFSLEEEERKVYEQMRNSLMNLPLSPEFVNVSKESKYPLDRTLLRAYVVGSSLHYLASHKRKNPTYVTVNALSAICNFHPTTSYWLLELLKGKAVRDGGRPYLYEIVGKEGIRKFLRGYERNMDVRGKRKIFRKIERIVGWRVHVLESEGLLRRGVTEEIRTKECPAEVFHVKTNDLGRCWRTLGPKVWNIPNVPKWTEMGKLVDELRTLNYVPRENTIKIYRVPFYGKGHWPVLVDGKVVGTLEEILGVTKKEEGVKLFVRKLY
ncbi:MAG TPA: hypothetical protein ENF51_00760 [Candidatus Aenigmarchaeota archaeon]|nr:hypothetical protein [Candidatus Aenigmarchaeota archaeon]